MLNLIKVYTVSLSLYTNAQIRKVQPAAPKMINNGRVVYDIFIEIVLLIARVMS